MKKRIIMISCICILLLLSLTGCIKKTAITTEEFKSIAKENNLTISDATKQYSNYGTIKQATIASITNEWQVEFYVLTNEAEATSMFNTNKIDFESYKGNTSSENSLNLKNSSLYSLTSSGYYMYVRRIDNTLVYAKVAKEYKDTVKAFIKKLGY